MNILFTLCGRAGSKGFKNKNLKDFLGHPLVYYSIATINEYIKKYGDEENIDAVLSTDSIELKDIVLAQSKVPFYTIEREEYLCGDSVPKVSVILDCLETMEKRTNRLYDIVVDLDVTSPLRTVENVREAIEKKMQRDDVDVVFSVTESRRNPYFNMVKENKGFYLKAIASDYTARQQAPAFFDMNASIYAYSPLALRTKEHKAFFNDKCDVVVMKDTGVLDIDSEEDYKLMQVIADYFFESYEEYGSIYQNVKALI